MGRWVIIFFILNMRVQILKNDLFLRGNHCKELRAGVVRENSLVAETKRTALLRALARGCSVVSGSP